MLKFLPALALVSCSIFLQLGVDAAHAIPKKVDRWIEIRSEAFTFYSNAGERQTEKIAKDLELLRKILSDLSPLPTNFPKPTLVFVFRSDSYFKPYKFLYKGEPANISGFFSASEHVNHIAIDASSTDLATEIIYHEFIHYYLHSNFPELPVWFNEGLAELYSSFDTDSKYANVGKAIVRHIDWLKNQPMIPLAELLKVDRSSATYNEGTRQGSFYAQSWALVHYLMVGSQERRPNTARFLELLAHNVPPDEAVRTAFEAGYETLERELRAYVRKMLFTYFRYELKELTINVSAARRLEAHRL